MRAQSIAKKRAEYRTALEETLRHITVALAEKPEVREAYLFGSYARGRRDLHTDLDILIIVDSELDFVTRTAEMYRYLAGPVDMDLLVYTPEELERNRDNPFIRRALAEGKRIYAKTSA